MEGNGKGRKYNKGRKRIECLINLNIIMNEDVGLEVDSFLVIRLYVRYKYLRKSSFSKVIPSSSSSLVYHTDCCSTRAPSFNTHFLQKSLLWVFPLSRSSL